MMARIRSVGSTLRRKWKRVAIAAIVLFALLGATSYWGYKSYLAPTETRKILVEVDGKTVEVTVKCFFPEIDSAKIKKRPAVVLLHGVEGPESLWPFHYRNARRIVEDEGYVVFFVHYFDGGTHHVEFEKEYGEGEEEKRDADRDRVIYESGDRDIWLANVKKSIEWAAAQPEVDSDRVGLIGYSLGGIVALTCADDLCSGPGAAPLRCVVPNFACKFKDETFSKNLCPVEMHHGSEDKVIPLEWARDTRDELEQVGVDVSLFEYEGQRHLLLGEAAEEARSHTYEFLRRHLK